MSTIATILLASIVGLLKGAVYDVAGEPLVGAYVIVVENGNGTITDTDGRFELQDSLSADHRICASFAGYEPDTVRIGEKSEVVFRLKPISLGTVTVTAKNGLRNMRTTTIQTQSIGTAELFRAACCNLSESFQTNASVDVSYSDGATGAKQIRLLGLSNQYVQMTVEKIPSFRGLATAYGLSYIPSSLINSIQISKGSGSVVDGYDAMTGQINIELVKPQNADRLSVSAFMDSKSMYQADALFSHRFNEDVSTMLFAHYGDDIKCMDGNDDSFMDMPSVRDVNVFNRWFIKKGIFRQQAGVKYIGEQREGGQMDVVNPYKIGIKTDRAEVFAKEGFIFDEKKHRSLGIILSATYHDMESVYGKRAYDAREVNTYLNAIYQTDLGEKVEMKSGANGVVNGLKEKLDGTSEENNERSIGLFGEFTYKPIKRVTAVAGVREDYIKQYGWLFTPRMHLMYSPTEDIQIRGSVSFGSRTPHLYAENPYLLISSREIVCDEELKRENSWNYGLSAQWSNDDARLKPSVSAEWYYTDFKEQMILDYDADAHSVFITNLNGRRSFSNTAQVEASILLFRGFSLTGAYRHTTVKQPTKDGQLLQKPLTGTDKVVATVGYETKLKKWQFDLTTQWNSGGRMPKPDAERPLWKDNYDDYALFNFQVTRHFKAVDIYAGCENIGGYRQKDAIISAKNPWSEDFDSGMIYAPLDGRKLYVRIKYTIDYER